MTIGEVQRRKSNLQQCETILLTLRIELEVSPPWIRL